MEKLVINYLIVYKIKLRGVEEELVPNCLINDRKMEVGA